MLARLSGQELEVLAVAVAVAVARGRVRPLPPAVGEVVRELVDARAQSDGAGA